MNKFIQHLSTFIGRKVEITIRAKALIEKIIIEEITGRGGISSIETGTKRNLLLELRTSSAQRCYKIKK